MPKLSVIIPSRNEPYLNRTIQSVFENARGEIEVVVHLDGYWPSDWQQITDKYPNLHTIHSGEAVGMRGGINKAVASAKSRGAKYVMKLDAHCGLGEGFDEILKAECDDDWIVVPRRKRLNPETWELTDTHKPDVDYHYLSFPDDPNDFGGPGLNGKIWPQRALERAQYELDEEMSSQGSGWFMPIDYFYRLDLMDELSYGKFWNEFQELGLKCWLSGGRVMVNKKTWYSHWHKGKAGRGYKLPESWLQQGATFTKNWIWNEAWDKQTKPFSWLIEHFWPVPTWPENWEEILYAQRKPRNLVSIGDGAGSGVGNVPATELQVEARTIDEGPELHILSARYGILNAPIPFREHSIDVTERIRSLVKDNGLDIVINNSTLTPGENPYRGKKKILLLTYNYGDHEGVTVEREEKDWLIIGPVVRDGVNSIAAQGSEKYQLPDIGTLPVREGDTIVQIVKPLPQSQMTAPALNDYLIRRFSISPQRLRGPMPIELRDFHRNDLAQLFAELGFKRGAEIGVAEGNYSEVLLKANPECELLLVDPWHHYSDNPQGKSKEKHEFAWSEMKRKTAGYKNVAVFPMTSMVAVQEVAANNLDFVYIDGHHSFDYVMQDLIEWSKRVRSGGIVSGDDYYALDEKRWGAGPVEAVQAYTKAHRIPIWYIFQGHKSVDFMWVRP